MRMRMLVLSVCMLPLSLSAGVGQNVYDFFGKTDADGRSYRKDAARNLGKNTATGAAGFALYWFASKALTNHEKAAYLAQVKKFQDLKAKQDMMQNPALLLQQMMQQQQLQPGDEAFDVDGPAQMSPDDSAAGDSEAEEDGKKGEEANVRMPVQIPNQAGAPVEHEKNDAPIKGILAPWQLTVCQTARSLGVALMVAAGVSCVHNVLQVKNPQWQDVSDKVRAQNFATAVDTQKEALNKLLSDEIHTNVIEAGFPDDAITAETIRITNALVRDTSFLANLRSYMNKQVREQAKNCDCSKALARVDEWKAILAQEGADAQELYDEDGCAQFFDKTCGMPPVGGLAHALGVSQVPEKIRQLPQKVRKFFGKKS